MGMQRKGYILKENRSLIIRAGEMAQKLRTLTTFAEHLSSVSSIRV